MVDGGNDGIGLLMRRTTVDEMEWNAMRRNEERKRG